MNQRTRDGIFSLINALLSGIFAALGVHLNGGA